MEFSRSGEFREIHGRCFAGSALAAIVVVASLIPVATEGMEASAGAGSEKVVNSSAVTSLEGWSAASEAGEVRVSREIGLTTPHGAATAIGLTRDGGAGSWAMAVGALNDPAKAFVVGRVYRMLLWVRDLAPRGNEVGILLADPNFGHRPTDDSCYTTLGDGSWKLLSRTFVATSPAATSTGFYVALPRSGPFRIQVSGASVKESSASPPRTLIRGPDTTIGFDGARGGVPDPRIWNRVTGGHGWGNGELQSYTSRTRNAHLDGSGNLRIIVRKETTTGPDGIIREYSSGRLTTEGKFFVEPGSYVEALILAPVGAGMWPAFWLGGRNIDSVGWPACGELDIMEGAGVPATVTHTALHMASQADFRVNAQYGWGEAGGTIVHDAPINVKPHTYGVYFDGAMAWFYVDRKVRRAVWADDALNSGRTWPFGQPFFIILNLAVSNNSGVHETTFPKAMTVGPISIWKGGVPAAG
jgi:hypothetical protein